MSNKKFPPPTMTLAVDVDGVIFDLDVERIEAGGIGIAVDGVRKSLRYLKHVLGYRIEIYSCRLNKQFHEGYSNTQLRRKIAKILLDNKIPFDGIALAKPYADFYIDDRGIRFKNWASTVRFIKRRTE